MVSYMVFWMKRHAPELKRHLEAATADALATGSAWALVGMAFLAVLREGLETAVFLLATFQASQNAGWQALAHSSASWSRHCWAAACSAARCTSTWPASSRHRASCWYWSLPAW